MTNYVLDTLVDERNYNEDGYLRANPDVAKVVREGGYRSGLEHFRLYGHAERRLQRDLSLLPEPKKRKRERIRSILRKDLPMVERDDCLDFLSDHLVGEYKIVDTDNVSSHPYEAYNGCPNPGSLIEKHEGGLVLDCGAGRRPVYYDNVVNFEIVDYDTTDVRGVGEVLPFLDNSFDAVLSLAVLEHVKDPFQCAKEIARVLKPGGDLLCSVPLLQPVHGYPHHYYNMTAQGLRNLFEPWVNVTKQAVFPHCYPIYTLTWIIGSWAAGLPGAAREEFLNMRVSELVDDPKKFLDRAFVTSLTEDKNFELASCTTLIGTKR